ncbi:MAG: hypothetical protein PHW53_01490 [Patescibacteria group bacterium]|nr:hypothetical protein [Patescibacteria group bacterium]
MAKMTAKKREEYRKRLLGIETELISLQAKLRDLKKRSRKVREDGMASRDQREIEKIRKQIGLT